MSVQAQPQHYARAIHELALQTWTRQLGEVQKAIAKDSDLRSALLDRGRGLDDRLRLLEPIVGGRLDPDVRKFLGTLLDAGDVDQLGDILAEIDRLTRRGPVQKTARVVTALALTPAEQAAFRDKVTRRFGPDLDFQFEVDPTVIGGVLLRVGDQVIDGTVAAKLAAMRDRLAV